MLNHVEIGNENDSNNQQTIISRWDVIEKSTAVIAQGQLLQTAKEWFGILIS
ncbi:MAG: hypothetical protein HQL97_04005 [Magnetococcales bacterium]|nr:hypothetical protein [Magnetococcales bacterium]